MRIIKSVIFAAAFLLTGTINGQEGYDLLLRAKALINSGEPDDAISILSDSKIVTTDSRLLIARADAKILEGDYQGAIVDLNSANKIVANCGDYGLARIYAIKGDPATSLYHLEFNLKSAFRKSEKEILLDPSFSGIENRPEWRLFWKKEWYSVAERMTSEIEYYLKTGKMEDAATILHELERSYPGDEASVYAATLVKIASGKPTDAIKSLNSLLAGDPENEKYLRTLAKAQTASSNHAGASGTYSRMIDLQVADPEIYMLRAESYRRTGEREKAMSDILKYLDLYPGSKTALSLAGKTESASGNGLKALEYFSENLRLHPNDPECYIDRGNSYLLSKSWQWAINDFSMSLDLDPGNGEVWLNKGLALANTGRTEDACHDFRRSFALGNRKAVDLISKYCIK